MVIGLLLNLMCGGMVWAEDFGEQFRNPPEEARPWTWWHWCDGYITRQGITCDLEAMKSNGVGGAVIFNVSLLTPGPVKVFGPEWYGLLKFAALEADRIGVKLSIHNCAGWETAGGPWVTPKLSMQQLSWSQLVVCGPGKSELFLPTPFARMDYYQDIAVLAFPTPLGDELTAAQAGVQFSAQNKPLFDGAKLTDGNYDTELQFTGELLIEFPQPFRAQSLMLASDQHSSGTMELSAETEPGQFQQIASFSLRIHTPFAGALNSVSFAPVTASRFKLTPHLEQGKQSMRLGELELTGYRISRWTSGAGFNDGGHIQSEPYSTPAGVAIDPNHIVDLSDRLSTDGKVLWEIPEGSWTILRVGTTTTGVSNFPAAEEARGLEVDKMSREAANLHVNATLGQMVSQVGPELFSRTFTHYFVDSYEAGCQNWSPVLPKEFALRCGYDLRLWLPAMTGRVVSSVEESERFLWDLRQTIANLYADNFYGQFAQRAKEYGVECSAETYGGPFDFVQSGGRVDLPAAEFWCAESVDIKKRRFAPVFAGHLYGKRIIGAEAFTGGEAWQMYPSLLKPLGDYMLTCGINRFIFHRYAHQPWVDERLQPGMTLGQVGMNFERSNTWWKPGRAWMQYLSRCQYLLQSGLYVADLVYLASEEPFRGEEVALPAPPGMDYDVASAEVVLTRMKSQNGRIVLPDGMSYRYLVIPSGKRMTPLLLDKIADLLRSGATVIGSRPTLSPSRQGYPACDQQLQMIADTIWGSNPAPAGQCRVGAGRVIWGQTLEQIVVADQILPDFTCGDASALPLLHHLHRQIGNTDAYFVAWAGKESRDLTCLFRVTGKVPELWNPLTGTIATAGSWCEAEGQTQIQLRLPPNGSIFVVFRYPQSEAGPGLKTVVQDGQQVYPLVIEKSELKLNAESSLQVAKNFTISCRVKPRGSITLPEESQYGVAWAGQNFVLYPAPGHELWGPGQAGLGISAGVNGVVVFEHAASHVPPLLVVKRDIQDWVHLAVVVEDNRPTLFLNGRKIKQGVASSMTLHGSAGIPINRDILSFSGQASSLAQADRALDDDGILRLASVHFDQPIEILPSIELAAENGRPVLLARREGDYHFQQGQVQAVIRVAQPPELLALSGPWTIQFLSGRGAPSQTTFAKLISWSEHSNPQIRYYSGTAAYYISFAISSDRMQPYLRHFLDLGGVEVIAELKLNGQELGVLWTEPYRMDVTSLLKPGQNRLEIRVTNLWVNRMVGDEQFPLDYECRGQSIGQWPSWLADPAQRPEPRRMTFSAFRPFTQETPLLSSGLIGPVKIESLQTMETQ